VEKIARRLHAAGSKILSRAEALARSKGIRADCVMLESFGGRAAEVIVAQARKWRADIIVAGTHGRRGLSRLVMGSDAELILRNSPVPVLLVRYGKVSH
jgi:nucleotide-binding universal stress UspA family protein